MFQPKIPTMPQPSGLVTPPAVVQPTTITPGTPAPAPAPAPRPLYPSDPAHEKAP
ncbi:SpdD-like protein, partial [Streptomyces parvus]